MAFRGGDQKYVPSVNDYLRVSKKNPCFSQVPSDVIKEDGSYDDKKYRKYIASITQEDHLFSLRIHGAMKKYNISNDKLMEQFTDGNICTLNKMPRILTKSPYLFILALDFIHRNKQGFNRTLLQQFLDNIKITEEDKTKKDDKTTKNIITRPLNEKEKEAIIIDLVKYLRILATYFGGNFTKYREPIEDSSKTSKSQPKSSPKAKPKPQPKTQPKSSPKAKPKPQSKAKPSQSEDDECDPSQSITGGLTWDNNSCYIDSVLVSLLYNPSDYVIENILERDLSFIENDAQRKQLEIIRRQLNNIRQALENQELDSCVDLRKSIKKYTQIKKKIDEFYKPIEWMETQQDTIEFIDFLLDEFQAPEEMLTKEYRQTNEGDIVTDREENSKIVYRIPSQYVCSIDEESIENLVTISMEEEDFEVGEETYESLEYIKELVESPMIIFHIDRNFQGKKCKANIIPSLEILGKTLQSIVVHKGGTKGGHYIAYIRDGNCWHEFNDMMKRKKFRNVGNFDELLQNETILKNSTQFIYT
jgi:hypothetical protein